MLHGHIVQRAVGTNIKYRNDMRVAQLRHQFCFADESLAEGRIGCQHRIHNLDGHRAINGFLHGKVNIGHATTADFRLESVTRNLHERIFPEWMIRKCNRAGSVFQLFCP